MKYQFVVSPPLFPSRGAVKLVILFKFLTLPLNSRALDFTLPYQIMSIRITL
jgi:hypothetical protein